MLIGIGASIYSGNRYDAAISSANLAARFDAALGITSSAGFASAWADQSGNGRNLLQATGANQPIHLAFAGTKYGWLPGVAGNYFSTPDSAAASITGDIDIRVKVALADWTPAVNTALVAKYFGTGNQRSYLLYIEASSGKLIFQVSNNGSAAIFPQSSTGMGFSDGTVGWVRATMDMDDGAGNRVTRFYKSTDGETWTLISTDTTAGTYSLFNSTAPVELGIIEASANPLSGKIYQAQIYNGIDGPLAVDFDPSRWTSGSTFTASTGETWTINSTGSKPAQIVDRPSLLFDGAAHYMKTAPFTLNQPETIFLVGKQVSWSANARIFDGNAENLGTLYQQPGTPKMSLYAGATLADVSLAIGTTGVVATVINGASSSIQVNQGAAVSGNAGSANLGGITLGASGVAAGFGNIQTYELLAYSAALDAATRANIIRALMSKHGAA